MESLLWCLILLVLSILPAASTSQDKQAVLFSGQQASPNGVMHFTANMFDEYASGKPRPYSLVLMLTAEHLMEQSNLQLSKILSEFKLAANAYKEKYATGSKAKKVFFGTLEFKESGHIFERLGINALPIILRVPGRLHIRRTGNIDIGDDEKMTTKSYQDYPWSAETIADFVKSRTGLMVDEIPRYSITQSKHFLALVLGALGFAAVVAYNLYYSPLMQNQWIYIVGSIMVCWFATSGGLFNIIRGVPFAVTQRDGSIQVFYPGPGQQLGAEGFILGTGYFLFSTMVLLMTYAVPKMASQSTRRFSFYFFILVAFIALKQIVAAYTAKTGYRLQQYMF